MSTKPSPPGAVDPVEIAGRYQVVEKLGAGAFGTVYKAKDKILGRMVAIKTIRLEGLAAAGSSLDELMERFQREAMVSAQLKHPHIVTIYDIDTGGLSYLAMEFIDGVGLDRVIATTGKLPIDRAASLGAQVADALDFAHRHNVVHRDIKPANIMVESGDRVKVTDFGIAKVTDSAEHLTATGSLLGTPSYMSPEQARGSAIDGRSDLFSLGCILYEMVTGKKAFRGESITGLIFKIITEEPPAIRDQDPSVPDEMVRIIGKALAKAPEVRYQTGREMADDLLALARPGSTPTLRQTEVDTAAGTTAIPGAPTIKSAPTLKPGPTMRGSSAPTILTGPSAAAGSPQAVARPVAPAAAASSGPRAAAAASPALPTRPTDAPRKSGIGLLVAIAAGGLLLLAAAAVAGYFILRARNQQGLAEGTPPTSTASTAPVTEPPPATLIGGAPITEAPATTPGDGSTRTADGTGAATGPRGTSAGPGASSETAGTRPATGPGTGTGEPATGRTQPGPKGGESGSTGAAGSMPSAHDAEADLNFLEREPPAMDGREVGGRVAEGYRQDRGTPGGTFGSNRRFRARERFPTNVKPPEMTAVYVLRNIIHFEEVYKQAQGQYGDFSHTFPRKVPPRAFEYHGYRFDLVSVDTESFKVVATPLRLGLRGFVADDSGYVRFADD